MALTTTRTHAELKSEVGRLLGVVPVALAAGSTRTKAQVAADIARALHMNNVTNDAGSTRTQQLVAEEIGRLLGAYGVGESTLATEDDDVIDDMIEDTVIDLYNRGMFSQTTVATIPQDEGTHLARICAAKLAMAYGLPTEHQAMLKGDIAVAENNLRFLQMDRNAVLEDVIEDTILDLYNRGLFSQSTSTTIPQDEATHLTKICAARIMTTYDLAPDNAQVILAQLQPSENMLYRLQLDSDDIIGDRLTEILMELQREGLIMFDVTDTSAVDIASFRSLAEIIAASLTSVFKVDPIESQKLAANAVAAKMRLKRMVFDGIDDSVVSTEYY